MIPDKVNIGIRRLNKADWLLQFGGGASLSIGDLNRKELSKKEFPLSAWLSWSWVVGLLSSDLDLNLCHWLFWVSSLQMERISSSIISWISSSSLTTLVAFPLKTHGVGVCKFNSRALLAFWCTCYQAVVISYGLMDQIDTEETWIGMLFHPARGTKGTCFINLLLGCTYFLYNFVQDNEYSMPFCSCP